MCVATPGRVIAVSGNHVTVDYNGNKVNANKGIVDITVGDYVLIHAGLVIQVLAEEEAQSMSAIYAELEGLMNESK